MYSPPVRPSLPVGLPRGRARTAYRQTVVTAVRDMYLRECAPPRFRATNVEAIEVDHPFASAGAVLCTPTGEVQALWASFAYQVSVRREKTGVDADRPEAEKKKVAHERMCSQRRGCARACLPWGVQEPEGEDAQCWAGMDIRVLRPALDALQRDEFPRLRSLEIECWPQPISVARRYGARPEFAGSVTVGRRRGGRAAHWRPLRPACMPDAGGRGAAAWA